MKGKRDVVCDPDESGERGSSEAESGKDAPTEQLQGAVLHQQKKVPWGVA